MSSRNMDGITTLKKNQTLQSPGGGGKGKNQADQLLLFAFTFKYLKYCCADVSPSWDVPECVVDYFSGSVTMISDLVG